MIPPYPIRLWVHGPRGAMTIPGVVLVDHGPAHVWRYLVVAAGYDEFEIGICPCPRGQYVTWASVDEIEVVRAEAA